MIFRTKKVSFSRQQPDLIIFSIYCFLPLLRIRRLPRLTRFLPNFLLNKFAKIFNFPYDKSCPFNVPFPKRIYDFRIWSSQPNYKELIRIGGRLAKLSTVPSPRRLGRVSNYNPRQSSPSSPFPVIYHFIRGTKEIRRSRENNGGERLDVSRAISRKSRWRVGGL